MSDYRQLLPKSGTDGDEDTEEEETHDRYPEKSGPVRDFFRKTILPRVPLGIQIYIALVVTVICVFQILYYLEQSKCKPARLEVETEGAFYEWEYQTNASFGSLDHKYDHLWKWPNGTGVAMSDPTGLTHGPVPVGISMFHQLHCLMLIRNALQSAQTEEELIFDMHLPHCMDYIRKSILCFADGTIEFPKVVDGKRVFFIDGDGALHKCKSSKELFDLRGWSPPDEDVLRGNRAVFETKGNSGG